MLNSNFLLRLVLCGTLLLVPVGSSAGIGKATIIAYEPQAISTISKSLTATGSTDILNVTEGGILLGIGIEVTTDPATTAPTVTIDITIDGGTTRSISMWAGALTWVVSFRASVGGDSGNDGNLVGNRATLIFSTPYLTSLRVAINVTTASDVQGVITATVLRGVQQ